MRKRRSRSKHTERTRRLQLETLEPRQLLAGDTFYVDAVNGNDGNDGSIGSPLATIQAGANAASAGDTVMIHAGVYRETVNVPVSGNAANPIIFQAVPGEEVIVSGADLVSGWSLAPGVGSNVWQATVNWDADGNRDGNTLFVNGELKYEARQGGENDPLNIDDWGLLQRNRLSTGESSFRADDLIGFPNDHWNGGKIKFHVTDFSFDTKTIADFNGGNGLITFDSPTGIVTHKQDNGYYIYDTINALDQAGEWFKAAGSNTLYYQAEPGQNPNNLEIEFKRRGFAFDVEGRDYIHIKDITFRGASIDTDGNTDHNIYSDNAFYAYDKANVGRFNISGDYNVFRDNEVSHVWGSFASVSGLRNSIVNNFIHDIGFNATSRAISAASAEELLVSHNTVRNYARSFMDGYPVRSEVAYNVFEDGGNLSWDTGVFDADGGGGDSSYSIFHHNIFRDNTDSRGIFEAFYGRNNNAVVHHNLFYDFSDGSRPVFRAAGTEFRQSYHNTAISVLGSAPSGELEARDAIGTRYNNNIQVSLEKMEALGVDVRGNYNYSPSDFNNFAGDDYTLAPGSGAIDLGIVLPGINDDYLGAAPDAGAFESGRAAWQAGHNFTTPPTPTYSWVALPGTNLFANGQFRDGIGDWTVLNGTPTSVDRNSWNLSASGASLTGTFRTHSVEFTPGEAIERTFTDLKPNTTYTIGTATRLANRIGDADDFASSFGSISSGTHRNEAYVTNMTAGEWVRYANVDFGDLDQYNRLDMLQIRNPAQFGSSIDGVQVQVRLGSPAGPLLTEFTDLSDGSTADRWRADRSDFSGVSGLQDLYVSVSGANAANIAIGSFRLLQDRVPAEDRLTMQVSSNGAPTQTSRLGAEDWLSGYEDIVFTTGPTATEAVVEFRNNGRLNAYLDRLYLIEGFSTRGADPVDLTANARAYKSTSPTTGEFTPILIDGSASTEVSAGDHSGSWVQVDLGDTKAIYNIDLTAPATESERFSDFRVSVWSSDPLSGGTMLWSQDFLTGSQSLDTEGILQIHADSLGHDGVTQLNTAHGRFVRVEQVGTNNAGGQALTIGDLKINGFDLSNIATTDGTATQSTSVPSQPAALASDNDSSTFSETGAAFSNSWWQTRFSQPFNIGQIEIQNRDDSTFSDLSNFKVSVWDEDPAAGGTKLWEKSYFSTGSVGQGETFLIDGGEVSDTSTRRLGSVHTGRLVRIELNGFNNNGNGRLSLADVRVAIGGDAPPVGNAAQRGIATQEKDFYGDTGQGVSGFAKDANDGLIFPLSNFTSTLPETGTWWQVDLQEATQIEQIVVFNRTDVASRLNNFRVTVWDGNPDAGGSELWGRNYNYSSGSATYSTGTTIGPGGALLIDGSDTDSGTRLDAVDGGRYVRVALNGSNILSLPEVQVWTPAESVDIASDATSLDVDLGTTTSPVEGGWLGVTPNSYGDAWWYGKVGGDDQSSVGASSINRDFVTSTEEATLNLRVQPGVYNVTLNMGDGLALRDNMMVWAESELVSGDIDSPAGQYSYVDENGDSPSVTSFEAIVRDGELNLRFDDAGDGPGAEAGWVLNRVSLDRVADLPPGPDTSLQLLVDNSGGALLRNTTGQAMSLVGYTVNGSEGLLNPDDWVGLGQQRYDDTAWNVSSTTNSSLSESGAPINLPSNGQIYLGRLAGDSSIEQLSLTYQLDGESTVGGYTTTSDLGTPRLVGDFNEDLEVNAADYTVWRDSLGGSVSTFAGTDANGDSRVDHSDYQFWRASYGDSLSNATLIDAVTGNGSFEDWSPQDAATRVIANNGTATIPGWTATTTNVGGWLRESDSAGTVGAASDGVSYAFAASSASLTLESDLLGHVVSVGEELIVTLDVGSRDGNFNSYEVSLLFGAQERIIGNFSDGTNATTSGLSTRELSYTAIAADAGQPLSLKIVATTQSSFSQTFVDNVTLQALGGDAAGSAAGQGAGLAESVSQSQATSVVVPVEASSQSLVTIDTAEQSSETPWLFDELSLQQAFVERALVVEGLILAESTLPSDELLLLAANAVAHWERQESVESAYSAAGDAEIGEAEVADSLEPLAEFELLTTK